MKASPSPIPFDQQSLVALNFLFIERRLLMGKRVNFCPSLWSGKNWPPAAYNPQTALLYIPTHENLCSTLQGEEKSPQYEPGKPFLGINRQASKMNVVEGADHIGELQAWDLKTGQKVWIYTYKH